jgi:hypothetical protein
MLKQPALSLTASVCQSAAGAALLTDFELGEDLTASHGGVWC